MPGPSWSMWSPHKPGRVSHIYPSLNHFQTTKPFHKGEGKHQLQLERRSLSRQSRVGRQGNDPSVVFHQVLHNIMVCFLPTHHLCLHPKVSLEILMFPGRRRQKPLNTHRGVCAITEIQTRTQTRFSSLENSWSGLHTDVPLPPHPVITQKEKSKMFLFFPLSL